MSFLSILSKGDEVIIPEPYWVSYTEQVKICGSVPVPMPYYEEIYNIEKYISKRKVYSFNNPHNPTEKYIQKEIEFLLKVAEKNNIYIISDEVYSDFVPVMKVSFQWEC